MLFSLGIEEEIQHQLITQFVDKIDILLSPHNMNKISLENRPADSYFFILAPLHLRFLIGELIRREILTYDHLLVLLHENTIELKCDENIEYTPYQPTFLELISKRCRNLEVLHYHSYLGLASQNQRYNVMLRDSIPRLENLREINFYDAIIEEETLRVISLNCRTLEYLNLHKTSVPFVGIKILCSEKSVIKRSLRTLIADYTYESSLSAVLCLIAFEGLKHFVSDSTFWGIFRLLDSISEVVEFQTTVLKNSFKTHRFPTPHNRQLTNFSKMFPNVNHLILISIRKSCLEFIKQIIPRMNITDLELSADVNRNRNFYTFESLNSIFEACGDKLTNLKLENFLEVDIVFLAKNCKNLRRLLLINNTYIIASQRIPNLFKNLKELQVILVRNKVDKISRYHFLNELALYSLLSSNRLKKILIFCQSYFSDAVMGDLFENKHLLYLNEILVYHCDNITNQTLWELVHNTRPIRKVEIGFSSLITEDEIEILQKHIKDIKLDISVTRVTKDPYFLRWSVVDLPISGRDIYNKDNDNFHINRIF